MAAHAASIPLSRFLKVNDPTKMNDAPDLPSGQEAARVDSEKADGESRPAKPMRRFTHAPVEPLPSPLRVRLQQSAFWLVPLLVVLLVGVIGVVIAFKSSMSRGIVDASMPGSSLFEAPVAVAADRSADPSSILASHIEVVGGRSALGNLRSMAISGRIDDGREAYTAQILGIKPGMGMLSFNTRGGQVERHYRNGETTWRLMQDRGRETLSELNVREVIALEAMTRIYDPLVAVAIEGGGMIASARDARYMGRNVHELRIDRFDGSVVTCYVDQESFELIGSREEMTVGSQSYEVEIRMSDVRLASGIMRPHASVIRINGELHARIFADSIRYNSGVMSSVFDIPEGLGR
jgi:hypothetical protein